MNLHKVVAGVIHAVNPQQPILVQASNGYTTGKDGKRTPAYLPGVIATAQVQQLTTRDLRQLEALNIQGSERKLYISGEIDAIIRLSKSGGDLIVLLDSSVWLTTHVLEQWPDWCAVSIVLQMDSAVTAQAIASATQSGFFSLDFSQSKNSMYIPGFT